VGRKAELAVNKTVNPVMGNPHNPNDPVNYLVTITNIGSETATAFDFKDNLPDDYFVWSMSTLAFFNGVHQNGFQWLSSNIWQWNGLYLNVPAGDPAITAGNPLIVRVE
jgi:uncharacterized repeat protein (TIGR01451 family)